MLTPEQAREALNQAATHEPKVLAAVKALPDAERRAAWNLLGRDPDGNAYTYKNWDARNEADRQVTAQLDAMKPAARARLWSALFPKLDYKLLERAWQALKTAPYQSEYDRKPFRTPKDPARTAERRHQWAQNLVGHFAQYNPDLDWVAAWTAHVDHSGMASGPLLAAAIDAGGPPAKAVLQTLRESAGGTHPIGAMGNSVIRALLSAGNPEGWEFVEKLLLAAQRQEGLRQSILEAIDESHPDAFRRMLRLILDQDLARFSATVRALNVWLGFAWDSVSVKVVNRTIERLVRFLDDAEARAQAVASGEAEDAYLALWSTAFEDAHAAVAPAAALLEDAKVERRYAAVHLLALLDLREAALPHLLKAYDDADLRVALRADQAFDGSGDKSAAERSELFECAERLLARLPAKRRTLEPIVWPWQAHTADRELACNTLLTYAGRRPLARLTRHLPLMNSAQRGSVLNKAVQEAPDTPETRALLLDMVSDASSWVRGAAFRGLEKGRVTPDEAQRLEPLLARKSDDLRRGVSTLLVNQADDDTLASADRLLGASKAEPRQAGLELLRQLAEAGRRAPDCRARAAAYQEKRPKLGDEEARQVAAVLDTARKVATLDDALGLLDPAERTRPIPPVARDRVWITPAALACLRSLSALVHEHREETVSLELYYDGKPREELLGNVQWGLPGPEAKRPAEEDAARLPLREVWETWWRSRPAALRDADGLELVRAWALAALVPEDEDEAEEQDGSAAAWCFPHALAKEIKKAFGKKGLDALPYAQIVLALIPWLLKLHPPQGAVNFLLDAVEASFSKVPLSELTHVRAPDDWEAEANWRDEYRTGYTVWLGQARAYREDLPGEWLGAHHIRLFRLLRWMDEPVPDVPRHRPNFEELLAAFEAFGATEADVTDQLLGPAQEQHHAYRHELRQLTGRKPSPLLDQHPRLRPIVDRCRARIVAVELDRGEAPTAASGPALALRALFGAETLTRLLDALGKLGFDRGYNYQADQSKAAVLSHLIRVTFPNETDTPEGFAAEVKRLAVPDERLVELAVYAPQWARFVEHALKWPQLEEAVWWLHAHTKGHDWTVDAEIREVWTAEVAGRTALGAHDLVDGAVDVAWFHRVHKALGPKRWAVLDEAAKFASGGTGHTRARLFASAMLGTTKKDELTQRATVKRYADALRALGLLPLAKGATKQKDVLDRYKVIQEFVRTSKQFGAQRQANEKRAAAISLDNLARTAGYADPIRLEWAMEASAVADLARGPVTLEVDGVTVALAIDGEGEAELTASRAGKVLKAIPPAVKKHKDVAALAERKTELKRQGARVRQSLEAAMCRGDVFTGSELKQLADHAVLWPLLSRLVLLGEGIAGYPVEKGRALRNHAGKLEPVKPGEAIRIAHPHDLLGPGDWHLWQHDCFTSERVQPFKQVFRELYVLTKAEKAERGRSLRYAGHQVNPKQAVALLGARGWVNHPEEGVCRTFHDAGLTACLDVMGLTFSPADVEGVTIESVHFVKRGEWKPVPLKEVPARLFSEVMRDLDLVVSVAHRGGVDPEASASTVEMRGTLLRETCALLRLDNVRVKDSHALIKGKLGSYSLHLGSGTVHRQPGGALCIVPVHAQHRGRLFLPFADDDPKTAEVISKALLLARDAEIQDPTILAQIRTAT